MRVVVLGAGFGGLELTTRLSDEFGADVDVVLIDKTDNFVFGFSKLEVMFGRAVPEQVQHPYRDFVKPGVQFVQANINAIDPARSASRPTRARSMPTSSSSRWVPICTPRPRPVSLEGGNEFYTEPGAFALRDVLANFGGGRVIVAVTSTPFKCPPAPSETALLMHDFLTERGLRDQSSIALVMPLPVPIPPSPDASKALLAAFAERGIDWHPQTMVRELDPARRVARDSATAARCPTTSSSACRSTVRRRWSSSRASPSTAGSR